MRRWERLAKEKEEIYSILERYSDKLDPSKPEISVILAAGHGKRIKSERSKMLHEIWGRPSVRRVCDAAAHGLGSDNQIIVLGKKALDVVQTLGWQ